MANTKGINVIYTEKKYKDGQPFDESFTAYLEGVQGDGSAIIYIEGQPYRVPAIKLKTMSGDSVL